MEGFPVDFNIDYVRKQLAKRDTEQYGLLITERKRIYDEVHKAIAKGDYEMFFSIDENLSRTNLLNLLCEICRAFPKTYSQQFGSYKLLCLDDLMGFDLKINFR